MHWGEEDCCKGHWVDRARQCLCTYTHTPVFMLKFMNSQQYLLFKHNTRVYSSLLSFQFGTPTLKMRKLTSLTLIFCLFDQVPCSYPIPLSSSSRLGWLPALGLAPSSHICTPGYKSMWMPRLLCPTELQNCGWRKLKEIAEIVDEEESETSWNFMQTPQREEIRFSLIYVSSI